MAYVEIEAQSMADLARRPRSIWRRRAAINSVD